MITCELLKTTNKKRGTIRTFKQLYNTWVRISAEEYNEIVKGCDCHTVKRDSDNLVHKLYVTCVISI